MQPPPSMHPGRRFSRRSVRRARAAAGAILLGLAAPLAPVPAGVGTPPLQAQTVGADSAAADSLASDTLPGAAGEPLRHPELVVRALRTPVPAAALPYAVAVRRPGAGVPSAGLSLASAIPAVPGLQVQSRYNDALGDRIVMRGFGARTQFGVRGIHVLVDGIPATMPDGQTTLNHLDLSRIERVEVLRGPAAAAYGNAAGGVLLLSTAPPPAAPFRQAVSASAGSGGLVRLGAASGGTRGGGRGGGRGGTGWVAALSREQRDGFRPHSGTERDQLTGRLETPLGGGYVRVVAHGVRYDADNPGSLTPEQYRTAPQQAQPFNVTQGTGEEGRHGQLGATWERPLTGARLEATLYALARSLDNPIPPSIIALDRRAGGLRLLLRSERAVAGGGGGGAVAWAVGLDGALQRDERENHENEAGERGALTLDQRERVRSLGAHGQVMLPLGSRVGALLAVRYDRVRFSAEDRLVNPDDPDDSGRRTMDAISPTAGLRLDLAPAVSLFGNVSTAFETPTTTELVNQPDGAGGFNRSLEPQRTVSIEVGARAEVAPGLRLEAAAYHARVRDGLIPFEVASAPGRQYFRNAGRLVHRGIELLAELRTRRLGLLAAYGRTDAEFDSYATEEAVLDGREVPGVRPWTVEVRLVSRHLAPLILESSYEAAGEMAADDANTVRAPGHHLLGVRAGTGGLRLGGWGVAPYAGVDNLFGERYVASVVPNAFGGRFFEPGPGRIFYLGIELAITAGEQG